jgi:hypothetical protein
LLDQEQDDVEREINHLKATLPALFIQYLSQFRATELEWSKTPLPKEVLERHQHYNATIDARKLELTDYALAMAGEKLARFRQQVASGTFNGPRIAHITDNTIHMYYCKCVTLRLTQCQLSMMFLR